eukprot:5864008-Pleurochrysis_carterae.AAC.1
MHAASDGWLLNLVGSQGGKNVVRVVRARVRANEHLCARARARACVRACLPPCVSACVCARVEACHQLRAWPT